jgi:hypothetical protein
MLVALNLVACTPSARRTGTPAGRQKFIFVLPKGSFGWVMKLDSPGHIYLAILVFFLVREVFAFLNPGVARSAQASTS